MTSLADRTIAALRSTHDELAAVVSSLSDDQLTHRSGAGEWTVAQVLSHLGSGAEISRATLRAAIAEDSAPEQDFNESVWDRWNALGPSEQAAGFVEHDASAVAELEALPPDQRETMHVAMGFLPAPLPLASFTGMRLGEAVHHSWDVRVALDPAATLDASSADVLADHFSGGLGFLLGFIGKADELSQPARVQVPHSDLTIAIDDQVGLSTSAAEPTATFVGELEAVLRLIAGRLTPAHTPAGVTVEGNVTLDDLRRVFPGY